MYINLYETAPPPQAARHRARAPAQRTGTRPGSSRERHSQAARGGRPPTRNLELPVKTQFLPVPETLHPESVSFSPSRARSLSRSLPLSLSPSFSHARSLSRSVSLMLLAVSLCFSAHPPLSPHMSSFPFASSL